MENTHAYDFALLLLSFLLLSGVVMLQVQQQEQHQNKKVPMHDTKHVHDKE